jgi:cell filamentation protein
LPDDPYVYPGTNTLRNRYGIRDPAELARLEADLSARRLAVLEQRRLAGAYDLTHLQAFHREIFGDVYEWAGEIRTVAIAKGDLFALPQHIAPYLGEVLAQLPGENFLRDLDRDPLVERLAIYLAEINSVHPFRDGNGRTQRAFIGQLAADAGYRIDWRHLDPADNIQASQAAHRGDNRPLRRLLDELTTSVGCGHKGVARPVCAGPTEPGGVRRRLLSAAVLTLSLGLRALRRAVPHALRTLPVARAAKLMNEDPPTGRALAATGGDAAIHHQVEQLLAACGEDVVQAKFPLGHCPNRGLVRAAG